MNRDSYRPTQRDIAKACGVSQMTVSLALRNSPRITEDVRQAILRVANELGWRPDPMLKALMAYRHRDCNRLNRATVAWLTNWSKPKEWQHEHPVYAEYFQGALSRSKELGYTIEEFWLNERGMTPKRMGDILRTRNIYGILLPPQPKTNTSLDLAWEHFAAVTFGFTLAEPVLHVATNNHFRSASLAVRELYKLGYRRVGIILNQRYDARVGYAWMAGCMMEQKCFATHDTIPVNSVSSFSREELEHYIENQKPDVILTNFWDTPKWLKDLGMAVPEDIGLAFLSVTERGSGYAGVNENSFEIGKAAMDLLHTTIQCNDFGIPRSPRSIMIDGTWVEGQTVRAQSAQ